MLTKRINSPYTSSAGRLFDAVASIIGIRHSVSFEGQAAMELEYALSNTNTDEFYPFIISKCNTMVGNKSNKNTTSSTAQPIFIIDWEPIIVSILDDLKSEISGNFISAKFHNTLCEIILEVAKNIDEKRIVLTGGCFQNKYLLERTIGLLQENQFYVYWHQRIPTNDGGISLGQIYASMREGQKQRKNHSQYKITEKTV